MMLHNPSAAERTASLPNVLSLADWQDKAAAYQADAYGSLRLSAGEPGWERGVQRVAVVVSASRSGSSLMFDALSERGDIVAPAGEHEPWMALSGNKWPFQPSDQLCTVNNRNKLLALMRGDLLVRQPEVPGPEYSELLWNRAVVRRVGRHPAVREAVRQLGGLTLVGRAEHERANRLLAKASDQKLLTRPEQLSDTRFFIPIEHPPFIEQPLARRATDDELAAKTLLFKSSADAHRSRLYESLFPNARISYIHLTRGFAQTVNGLMDGWTKTETGFVSHALGLGGSPLDIQGYSTTPATRTYWCFDLFDGWQAYTRAPLAEVCARQWLEAHASILGRTISCQQVQFESFYTDPNGLQKALAVGTGVNLDGHDWSKEVMSTEKPGPFRWRKRAELFRNLGDHLTDDTLQAVTVMQERLGYTMDESTWY